MMGLTAASVRISRLTVVGGILTALLPVALLGIGYTLKTRALLLDNTLEQSQVFATESANYLDKILTDHKNVLQIVGQEIGDGSLDAAEATAVLIQLREKFPLFSRFSVVSADGIIRNSVPMVADSGSVLVGLNVADRNYFQAVVKSREPVIDGRVIVGRLGGGPTTVMAAPILGKSGVLSGVLVASLDLESLRPLIDTFHVGITGHAVAVTNEGIVVSHPDTTLVEKLTDFSRQPIWQEIRTGTSGRMNRYRDETGVPRFGAFATVAATGWKVWISQEISDVDQEFYAILLASSIWPAAAVLLGIALSYLLARTISNPIETLHRTATDIAGGDFSRRAPEMGPSELASLAEAINAMAATLQENLLKERAQREAVERAVTEYGRFAEKVASGDFSSQVTVPADGDLGRLGAALNAMSRSLNLVVSEIKTAVTQLGSATAEILAATSQQAAATSEEAAAVRQMATSVHELRQAADSVARRTQAVVDMAQRTESVAEAGLQSVEETVRIAEQGRQRLETLAERVMGFSERTYEIAEINAAVAELAEKSNLLAVNASIEATKAGEAGRGFAVVAQEVKELAEQSKAATAQVRRILGDIQRSAQAAVIAAEQYARASDAGVATSRQAGASITTLAGRVTEAAQAARQNVAAAEQQHAGIEQIALAVDNIEMSSAQTVSATAQVEQSASSLHDLSRALEGIVSRVSVSPVPDRKAS